jgi:uncharacterized protein (TIGR03000 family)
MLRIRWCCPILLAVAFVAPLAAQEMKPVRLKVQLPRDDAELSIEGTKMAGTGKTREFESPGLPVGKKYEYTLVAVIKPNNYTTITRKRKFDVEAGKSYDVDMLKNDMKSPDDIVIRWVPTPNDVVQEMLKLGGMTKDDVVYDLGCGDGRMVIAAVKAGAKRGVGIDIDPAKVKDSKEAVARAGVGDKVEIREGDVLKVKDISDASLILLYMSDDLNLALRPILQKQLKPGSRIVSHRFIMGDWKPEKEVTIKGQDGDEYELKLWIVGK